MPSAPSGVLWDLDGTLVDSEELHWLSWRDTMASEGHELTYEQFLGSFGQKNDRILTAWLGAAATPDRIQRVGDAKEAEYRRLARDRGLTPLPGAAEWIRRLHARGWKQAIASSAPRENVSVMLHVLRLDHDFDAIVGAEDVSVGKPDPQVFLTAAGKLGLAPARCIVVEDVPAGVEAARRAGMRSIGVSRTSRLEADVAVRSLLELDDDVFERLVAEER
jgi:HAD superfamily hydrolase (TIGR01509 family)